MYAIDSIKTNVEKALEGLTRAVAEVDTPEFRQRCLADYPGTDHYPAKAGYLQGAIWKASIYLVDVAANADRAAESVTWLERCAAICEALGIDEENMGDMETLATDIEYRRELRDASMLIANKITEVRDEGREREYENAITMLSAAGFAEDNLNDCTLWRNDRRITIEYKSIPRGGSREYWYEFILEVDGLETLSGRSGEFSKLLEAVGISREVKTNG